MYYYVCTDFLVESRYFPVIMIYLNEKMERFF